MTFQEYISHYLKMPDFLFFFLISFAIVCVIHLLLVTKVKATGKHKSSEELFHEFKTMKEAYYELLFSSTSMLFFTGIYFIIDFHWVPMSSEMIAFWEKYNDFLLLGLMVLSILLINILDSILIPLKKLDEEGIGSLRMAGLVYMLILFAYIKFIYLDDNYDTIIFYFLTMLVGRYVYLDASFHGFRESLRGIRQSFLIVLLVLLSTALLALYGFKTDYLLTSNSVAVSLWISHCFVIFECFLLTITGAANKIAEKLLHRETGDK